MLKFAKCYEADGLMWCQHFNGSYAPPFPVSKKEKEKPSMEISIDDDSIENQNTI